MYQPLDTDVSGRNFQAEMKEMLHVLLPVFETRYGDFDCKAAAIVKEFNDICEFTGGPVRVTDRAQAVVDYLNHHYRRWPKPAWYANLTGR